LTGTGSLSPGTAQRWPPEREMVQSALHQAEQALSRRVTERLGPAAVARLEALVATRERTVRRLRCCRSPKERAQMTCTRSDAAVCERGGLGLSKVPRVQGPVAADEAASSV
jgi:hypothetical protein